MILPAVFLQALIQVESGGNDQALGAKGEIGCLQIRRDAFEDFKRHSRPGGDIIHTFTDCYHRDTAKVVCQWYLWYWCNALPHPATFQDAARIWNGGPKGWEHKATLPYWAKLRRMLPAALWNARLDRVTQRGDKLVVTDNLGCDHAYILGSHLVCPSTAILNKDHPVGATVPRGSR